MRRRDALTLPLALAAPGACGRSNLPVGEDIGVPSGAKISTPDAVNATITADTDLRTMLGSDLFSWHVAELGIHVDATMLGVGSRTPLVTLSGNLDQALAMRIGIDRAGSLGRATFRWAKNNLGAGWEETGVPTGPEVQLGDTGLVASFSAGSYDTKHFWQTAVERWDSIAGNAGCTLDSSTVAASSGVLYEINALNSIRAALHCAPGMLGNQSALGSILSGNATQFHLFALAEMSTLAATTATLALLAWSSQTDDSTDIIQFLTAGPTASVAPNSWGLARTTSTGVTQRVNSSVEPDLAPRLFEARYDGDTLLFRINGFDVMSMPWNGAVECDRVTIGGVKFGEAPATLFSKVRFTELIVATKALGDAQAEEVRLARG